jgi:hypothetical protein
VEAAPLGKEEIRDQILVEKGMIRYLAPLHLLAAD